ncbi:MAG: SHOCT domain-containing protein [Stackebrandtia sp.]
MMYWHDAGFGWGMFLFNTLLFWALLAGMAWVFYGLWRSRRESRDASRAEQTLAERHARGEIDAEEFESRSKTLRRFGN